MIRLMTKMARRFLVGNQQRFIFTKVQGKDVSLPALEEIDVYIHIPFCKSMCPYCPYHRVRYDKQRIPAYFEALSREIDLYAEQLGRITLRSVYIGGGTPTNAIDELALILEKVKTRFNVVGDIAIETTVADIHEENLQKLQRMGVTILSVGVQSFHDAYLKLFGRPYTSQDIFVAFDCLKKFDFKSVNVDLIFAFPHQTEEELLLDLKHAVDLGVDQVTTYPLFTFPYSTVGEYRKIKQIRMPPIPARKRLYRAICRYLQEQNYHMVSVWGFHKAREKPVYSSVTRNTYIGFGAGAGSRLEHVFYLNTFSIEEYERSLLEEGHLPVAIEMPMTRSLSDVYWLYWKIYEGGFSFSEFQKRANGKLRFLMKLFLVLGFCEKRGDEIRLTEKGSFWIHLAQNFFVLDYINTVWMRMKREAFPDRIEI